MSAAGALSAIVGRYQKSKLAVCMPSARPKSQSSVRASSVGKRRSYTKAIGGKWSYTQRI